MTTATIQDLFKARPKLLDSLYEQAGAKRWSLSSGVFSDVLHRSVSTRFKNRPPDSAEFIAYVNSLRLSDLALACACAEGSELAWEHFVCKYREDLYAAARAIVGSSGPDGAYETRARELADSLYAELYGLADSTDSRRSLFRYFHGRSKLSTWLRAVLSQRHVDMLRAAQRWEPLENDAEPVDRAGLRTPARVADPDPDRARYLSLLQGSLVKALGNLNPRDRLRLSSYYIQDLTLAQIGRILGEHEATVSRHLDRIRRALRHEVESSLHGEHRLSPEQIDLCLEYALDDWPHDLSCALSGRLPEHTEE